MKKYKLLLILFSSVLLNLNGQNTSTEYLIAFEKVSFKKSSLKEQVDHNIQIRDLTKLPKVVSIERANSKTNLYLLQSKGELSEEEIALLKKRANIKYLFPNSLAEERYDKPNDSLYFNQWNLERIGALEIWDSNQGGVNSLGEDIVVAVIDSDFDINHEDLYANIYVNSMEFIGAEGLDDDGNGYVDDISGYDFKENEATIQAGYTSHGTAVSGIIGAQTNNSSGIAGLNWWTKIVPLKVFNFQDYLDALLYCYELRKKYNDTNGEEGALLVAQNTSLGYNINQDALELLEDLADDLGSEGILSIQAAPNQNEDIDEILDLSSNKSDYVISVGSSDIYDNKVNSSGYGKQNLDLAAPGGNGDGLIPVLKNNDSYDYGGGTSYATPLVCGSVALLYNQVNNQLDSLAESSPAEAALLIKSCILNGTEPLDDYINKSVSEGRLNVFKSLLCLHQHFQTLSLNPENIYINNFEIFEIFPNPSLAEQEIKIIFAQDNFNSLQYAIYDLVGKEIKQGSIPVVPLSENKASINIRPHLSSGIYTLVLSTAETSVSKKLIIH